MKQSQRFLALLLGLGLTMTTGCSAATPSAETSAAPSQVVGAANTTAVTTTKTTFSDVPADAWYAEAVEFVNANGIMTGTDQGFEPGSPFTRAQVATVFYRMAKEPAVSGEDAFTDTQSGLWYSDAVLWADQTGLVQGYGNGLFGTNDPVTQEQLVTILHRYAEEPAGTGDSADVDPWYQDAIAWARGSGLVGNDLGYSFAHGEVANRSQVAALLYSFFRLEETTATPEEIEPIPAAYTTPAQHPGEVVRFDYATGNEDKFAYIYVPYGYNENEKYDILYMTHGGGGSAGSLFGGAGQSNDIKNALDHLIENGEMDPILIVTPTFYTQANSSTSVSGSWDAVKVFPQELTEYLMPAVETAYSTWAETADDAGFAASRNHRAFGGFSMGSVTTWYVFQQNMRYFRTFLPISGDSWAVAQQGGRSDPDATAKALAASVAQQGYGTDDFQIYAVTGTEDIAEPCMTPMMASMAGEDVFQRSRYGNTVYRICQGGTHDTNHVRRYLYHILPELYAPGRSGANEVPEDIQETGATVLELEELPTYPYTTREIEVTNNGQRIYGVAYIPEAEGKLPLALCAHGLGGSYRSCAAYAEQFASHGIAAYCFDFRGGGGTRSEGSTTEMSVMTEVSDLEAILTAAKGWDFVDTDRIMLLGASQGGIVSAITAARHPDDVAGLVLCYPAFLVHDAVREQFRSLEDVPDTYQFNWIRAGRPYAADMWDYDVYAEIGSYTGKVLLLHGTADSIVPISYADRAAETYADVDYFKINGAGHGFSGSAFNEAIGHIFDYVQEVGVLTSNKNAAKTLRMTVGDTVGTAELTDTATTRAFLELLPLTITLRDLHGREYWFSHSLPYDTKDVVHDYAPGQLTYWCGGWVTAYYDRDDDSVIEDGSVVIGAMSDNLVSAFHALNGAATEVKFEIAG